MTACIGTINMLNSKAIGDGATWGKHLRLSVGILDRSLMPTALDSILEAGIHQALRIAFLRVLHEN